MEIEDVIEQLELKKERLLNALPEKKRLYFQKIEKYDDTRGMLLYGPRGVGKTTYLLMKAAENNFFYLSGDDPKVAAIPLFDLGEKVFLQGYNGIIIDEVHYLNKWSIHIKALYDSYPDKKIWISDSSSIILRTGIADLSRRFVKVRIPLLSFREYIHFLTNKEIMEIENPFNIEKDRFMNQIRDMDILKLFKDYASSGTRPFFLENNYVEKMENILEKTLYSDIPFFLNTIKENHLKLMKAIIGYLIYSKIPTINVERMGKEWQLSKNKLYELLNVMEEAELINIVLKEKDFKINSKGEKIFLADPSYYYIYNGEIGNFREAFTVFALKEKGKIFSSKNEQDGDFVWNGIKIEVGGKNKKIKNSDFVIRDDIDLPLKNKIPLWLLGFLW
ncbi:ATPase AAA [Marinitoga sp. 1135]|uniref:ATP-binding protein n=1 Tax=unclassified Marinitoga TaxID=2640159 RepID=UPI00095073CF|nr:MULTISPECIES: AAA family ATPase [unclassified Marinitoga]APT76006.1 ATPase AAA [Marinitoga sp. 1137]NUU95749.1 ATPase AAA [Marinitoga sp. 1135]